MEETPEHWDDFWRSTSVIYPHETTIAAIEGLRVESVLEVGAGSGRDLEELNSLGYRVGFSDISSEAVRRFEARNPGSIALRVDARNLPLADDSFDLVMSLGVLEHFDREERGHILREQFRIAKRYILVDVPQKWAPATFITKALNAVGAWPHGDESPFAYGDLLREVKEETKPKRVVSVYGRELIPLPRNFNGRFYSRLPSPVRRQYVRLQQHFAWGLAGCTGIVFEKAVSV